jgi:hypothetical protein
MPLRGPFDQLADSLSAVVSDFVRDFLTPVMTIGVRRLFTLTRYWTLLA